MFCSFWQHISCLSCRLEHIKGIIHPPDRHLFPLFISATHFYWASACNYYLLTFIRLRQTDAGLSQDKWHRKKRGDRLKTRLTSLSSTVARIHDNDFIIQSTGRIAAPFVVWQDMIDWALFPGRWQILSACTQISSGPTLMGPVGAADEIDWHLWAVAFTELHVLPPPPPPAASHHYLRGRRKLWLVIRKMSLTEQQLGLITVLCVRRM